VPCCEVPRIGRMVTSRLIFHANQDVAPSTIESENSNQKVAVFA
jgi:hypothetical protein